MFSGATLAQKVMWLPPDTPQEIVDVYRRAFADAMQDPDLADEIATTLGTPPEAFIGGAELEPEFHQTAAETVEREARIAEVQTELFDEYVVQ